jgi:hypothetical protein
MAGQVGLAFSAFSASSCSKFLKRNGRAQGFAMKLMRHPEDLFEQEIAESAEIFLPLFPCGLSAKPWFHKSAPGRIRRTTPSVTFLS